MVYNYFQRFPKSDDSARQSSEAAPRRSLPRTPQADLGRKNTPPPARLESIRIPDSHIDTDGDGGNAPEVGGLPQDDDTVTGDEWNDYIAPTPPSLSPPQTGSPPEDIGGFHSMY